MQASRTLAPCGQAAFTPVIHTHKRSQTRARCVQASGSSGGHPTGDRSSRRDALASAALLALVPALLPRSAAAASDAPAPAVYADEKDGFTLAIPAGWSQGTGDLNRSGASEQKSRFSNAAGLQRVVAWVPPTAPDVSLAVTIRTPGADFTSLGSFGTAQDFGGNVVVAMDRSYLLKGGEWARKAGGGGGGVRGHAEGGGGVVCGAGGACLSVLGQNV